VKVHIVDRDHQKSDRILPRLARVLANENGWTIGATPNGTADLNYFSSYLEVGERFHDWHQTHIAAYFTHYDDSIPYKSYWWEMAATQCDLRVATAPMYLESLSAYGPTVLARPPVDQRLFTIRPKEKHDKPCVGLSGFVQKRGSDRKGTKYVSRLMNGKLGRKLEIIASGIGWPCPTRQRKFEELPSFYASLDVFLCTSVLEGNPMPPLEALACGVPVVIPRGVGLLDNLPDTLGIYRYDKGNFAQMCEALQQACFGSDVVDVQQLRGAIAEYTPQTWATDHRKAFENLLFNVPKVTVESDRHGKRGVYCVAYGKPARKCAGHMMTSFREFMPADIEIALVSTEPIGIEDHFIECKDVDIGGRYAKTLIYDLAPKDWGYIMYLDADIELFADVSWLYQPLFDGFDFVICTNPSKYHIARKMRRSDNADECEYTFNQIGTDEIIQLNGGVFTFQRNQRTREFFSAWHAEWNRWGKRDQAALLRALWKHPMRVFVLTNVWNCITRYVQNPKQYSAGILHYPLTARRWRGIVKGRSDSEEAWSKVKQFKSKK